MWDRAFGCALGALLLVVACGKSAHSPGEDPDAPAQGGGGAGGSGSGGAGNSSAGQKPQAGKPATGGEAPANGGASATSGAAGLTGIAGAGGGAAGAGQAGAGQAGATSSSCDGSYLACGCGCCAATVPACYYPELGESRAAVEMADKAAAVNLEQCMKAGCTAGKYYQCCEGLPPESARRYGVSLAFGGLNHLIISKFTEYCSSLGLAQPLAKTNDFPLKLPQGWDIQQLQRAPCDSGETKANAIGALGTVALRAEGEKCVVDAHFTAFFADQNSVEGERFDFDGYPLDMGLAFCK